MNKYMKKVLIIISIIIISIIVIFSFLNYWFHSELEIVTYKDTKYESFSSDLILFQSWDAVGRYFKYTLPYKKYIYASPYTYTINFNVESDEIDYITFEKIDITYYDEQVSIINNNTIDIIIRNEKTYTKEEIENFRRTKKIILERGWKFYYVNFKNIEIPFKKIKNFNTVLSIKLHYKSGETISKEITTEFEKIIEKRLKFLTT